MTVPRTQTRDASKKRVHELSDPTTVPPIWEPKPCPIAPLFDVPWEDSCGGSNSSNPTLITTPVDSASIVTYNRPFPTLTPPHEIPSCGSTACPDDVPIAPVKTSFAGDVQRRLLSTPKKEVLESEEFVRVIMSKYVEVTDADNANSNSMTVDQFYTALRQLGFAISKADAHRIAGLVVSEEEVIDYFGDSCTLMSAMQFVAAVRFACIPKCGKLLAF